MVGYLIAVVSMAAVCSLAIAPPVPASSSRSHWTYVLGGFLVNELPFVAVFWLGLWTAQAVASGNLGGPLGLVGVAVALVAVVEVVVIARRGFAARPALAATLRATLGDAGATPFPLRHRWARIVFAPLSFRGREVRRVANRSYGDAGRRNQLDVYHHRTRRGGPVLVYFHGGGFRSGHKNREAKPLLHRLARRGWVCISANYRLEPGARFPDALIDAKRAIVWARRHAGEFGGDPATIVVAGSSAGGHLATMCALTANQPEFQPAGDDVDTAVDGAISLYGFYGAPASRTGVPSSPHSYLRADAPPMFVAHGDLDTLVLVDDARAFAAEHAATSASPVVYAELAGAHHGFDLFRSARFEAVVDAIERFLDDAVVAPPATASGGDGGVVEHVLGDRQARRRRR